MNSGGGGGGGSSPHKEELRHAQVVALGGIAALGGTRALSLCPLVVRQGKELTSKRKVYH